MSVAILIVSFDSLAELRPCLAALEASTYTDFRILIRENAGPEAREVLVAALPQRLAGGQALTIVPGSDNVGYAGGINACLTAAGEAEAYWVLNPDTVPAPNALAEAMSRLGRGDCSMVGHDLVLPDGVLASRGGGDWRRWSARAVSIDHGRPREPRPDHELVESRMNYVVGASMLVSPRFVARIGPMREEYFLYCEEIEWCLRGLAAGERLGYASEALVLHAHGASTGAGGPMAGRSKLSVYLQERNRLHVTRDVFPKLWPVAVVLALCHLILRYGKSRAWRQLGYALQGWTAGVRNERGRPAWMRAPAGG